VVGRDHQGAEGWALGGVLECVVWGRACA
jgi:hypothetical protein